MEGRSADTKGRSISLFRRLDPVLLTCIGGVCSGKVLVPTSEHISRLQATRLQWDILGSDNLLIARTDSEASFLLSSNIDPRE